jgi:polyhydroxyalkanoate synthase
MPVIDPEVIDRTAREVGLNLFRGMQSLIDDLVRVVEGAPPPDTERFRPGIEVASTTGDVVFRNELIELIRYMPMSETAKPEP